MSKTRRNATGRTDPITALTAADVEPMIEAIINREIKRVIEPLIKVAATAIVAEELANAINAVVPPIKQDLTALEKKIDAGIIRETVRAQVIAIMRKEMAK